MEQKKTYLVDAILLLEMFVSQNPGTMIPAVIAHIKAAQEEHETEIERLEKIAIALSDQLDEADDA